MGANESRVSCTEYRDQLKQTSDIRYGFINEANDKYSQSQDPSVAEDAVRDLYAEAKKKLDAVLAAVPSKCSASEYDFLRREACDIIFENTGLFGATVGDCSMWIKSFDGSLSLKVGATALNALYLFAMSVGTLGMFDVGYAIWK